MLSLDISSNIKVLGQNPGNVHIFHKFKSAFEVEFSNSDITTFQE